MSLSLESELVSNGGWGLARQSPQRPGRCVLFSAALSTGEEVEPGCPASWGTHKELFCLRAWLLPAGKKPPGEPTTSHLRHPQLLNLSRWGWRHAADTSFALHTIRISESQEL